MSANSSFDVLTVGAGLVGASFALALRDSGLRCALIEGAPPSAPTQHWDRRIYAISPASADFLREIGVWQRLDPERIQNVERMEIHGDRADAQLDFSAYDAGASALAYILESGRLQTALWQALQDAHVEIIAPARSVALEAGALQLEDGRMLQADLLVGADGGNSWLRRAAGIEVKTHAYHQQGVVANFECTAPHEGIAFQWFRGDSVLALLPLPGRRVSMVWSTSDAHAQALLQKDPADLCREVEQASGKRLGVLESIGEALAFPLQMLRAERSVTSGIALIGDAAHIVHPLAGQGVNLGFGDARKLAEVLLEREPGRRCGDEALLRRYERQRAEALWAMRGVTHGLERLFARPDRISAFLRNTGLNLSNRLPVLKTWLVRHALN